MTSLVDLNRTLYQTLKPIFGLPDRVRKLTITAEADKPPAVVVEYHIIEAGETLLMSQQFGLVSMGEWTKETLNVGDECSTLASTHKEFAIARRRQFNKYDLLISGLAGCVLGFVISALTLVHA